MWLATYFMLHPLGYSGVHDTVPLNLYTFTHMLHCLCGVYILNTSTPPFTKESGWVDTELWVIKFSSSLLSSDKKDELL